jgi:hypothetical protein
MMPRVAGPPYSDEQIEAAVQALSEPGRLDEAQRVVGSQAPQLQRILNEALDSSEWFGTAHDEQVLRAAGVADPDARLTAVKTLLAEETRIVMLIGVAVGLALSDELKKTRGGDPPGPPLRPMET